MFGYALRSRFIRTVCLTALTAVLPPGATAQKRLVVADQDATGPGGSDMVSLLVLLQAPNVDLLGISVVTGDGWRDAEVAHTLRLLEFVGRTDIKVYPGAAFPLVRTQESTHLAEALYGKATYKGAWSDSRKGAWDDVSNLREGSPTTRASEEDAAHFMIRMVHEHPHQVTIYGAGPLTNIALAIRLDPHFAELAQELVLMGGSVNAVTDAKEWVNAPRHEFNFWFDPEASSITLRAHWPKISITTIDSSLKTHVAPEFIDALSKLDNPVAKYIVRFTRRGGGGVDDYLWDELAAATWIDPSITTKERYQYIDVSTEHGSNYGDVLLYEDNDRPEVTLQRAHLQIDIDGPKLDQLLVKILSTPTPGSHNPAPLPAPEKQP
jgi:purine nucleosidase